ncbi:MAG: nucleotidyltransferase family protein [Devosia sp.]
MSEVAVTVSASSYLRGILAREAVDAGMQSPLRHLEAAVDGICRRWAGRHLLEVYPTGAFEKGTANRSGIAIDFLVSLSPAANYSMPDVHETLFEALGEAALDPVRRNVSLAVKMEGIAVDIVPARRVALTTDEHVLFSRRTGKTFTTNPTQHVLDAIACGRREEIRILKLWRDQQGLDLPSFNLELAVLAALRRRPIGELSDNVWAVFGYLDGLFSARSLLDPANANNIVSDQMTAAQKDMVRKAAQYARAGRSWQEIIG